MSSPVVDEERGFAVLAQRDSTVPDEHGNIVLMPMTPPSANGADDRLEYDLRSDWIFRDERVQTFGPW